MQSKKLFIDSSIFIAFIDRADANHQKATKALENLSLRGFQLYTSLHTVTDTYALLTRELGLSLALEFLQSSLQSDIEILFPQKADLITANRILKINRERQISLREVLNATLMQKRGIGQILTFTYWYNLFGTYVLDISNLIV